MSRLHLQCHTSDASHRSVADVFVREEPDEDEEADEDDGKESDDGDDGSGYSE
jgi:hypothetical protein